MSEETLIKSNISNGSTISQTQYSEFISDFVAGVNEKLEKAERNLYDLGEFIVVECEKGKVFGKTKSVVFDDLCSHPDFKYGKKTLYNYKQTAEFIRQLPEHINREVNLPFTSVREIAEAKLPRKEKIKLYEEVNQNPIPQTMIRQKIQAQRIETYPSNEEESWVVPYDVWQFQTCDPRFGTAGFPGRIPGQIVLNLIHYYMEGSTFLSVYAGSHTDRDVCNYLGKTCIELDQNVRERWNVGDDAVDLVFHDPPYWHAKAGEYQRDDDLSHLSLDEFYEAIDFTARESNRVLKDDGVVAIIIGNERNPYEDLAFSTYQIFKRYFIPLDRIAIPYAGNSSMHTAWAIARAKDTKQMLNGFRDLMIFSGKRINGIKKEG